jgi:hypothetical protein
MASLRAVCQRVTHLYQAARLSAQSRAALVRHGGNPSAVPSFCAGAKRQRSEGEESPLRGSMDSERGYTMKLRLWAVFILGVGLALILGAWLSLAQASPEGMSGDRMSFTARRAQNVELVGQIGGPAKAVASQGDYAYVVTGPRLVIVDISDPANPTRVGSHEISVDYGRDVAVAGAYAYIAADEGGLRVLDVSDPANPVEVGFEEAATNAWAVTVVDDYAYVAGRMDDLHIVDVSDPTSPSLESTYTSSIYDLVQDVAVTSSPGQIYAHVGYFNHLFIVDVTDPSSPSELGIYTTTLQALAAAGSYVYVAAGEDGLRAIDVSDPLNPTLAGTLDTPGYANAVAVSGTHAYVADGDSGLRIINISNPSGLSEDGFCDTPDEAEDVVVTGNYALVADDERGLRIVDVSDPETAAETGAYDVTSAAWSLAVSGTLAYVGDYYMGLGASDGALRIVDVADPANPAQAGFAELSGRGTGVGLAAGYAYLSGYLGGLLVVDVSDPASPSQVASSPTPKLAHDVVLTGSHAYVAESQGVYVFDISNPPLPAPVGTWPTTGSSVYCVAVAGHYVYAGVGNDGLRIIDVSNPVSPTNAGFYSVPDSIRDVVVVDDLAYVAADGVGLHIVDVSNPVSPTLAGIYDGWDIVQGVAVAGAGPGRVLAYILGEYWDDDEQWQNGLAVLDVSDPAHPFEVGFHNFLTESYAVAAAEGSSGQTYIYVANLEGGVAIFRVRYHRFLPLVLRNR